jgi:MFS family permease
MGRYPMPVPEEDATVAVIVANLKSGLSTLFGHPILRSLFFVGALMFFSFGLWNVLLLPMSLRELHATEFEYGLQEGLTSVGFVIGSFFMARFSSRLPESGWVATGLFGMGLSGLAYSAATSVPLAIVLVMISGFFNSPTSVARSVLLQRNTPREMRGRVFSAYYVMRDVIFVIGMAGAGLADIINVRQLIAFASVLLFGAATYALLAPGIGIRSLRAARTRLEEAAGAPALGGTPFRPATLADFDLLIGKLPTFARLSEPQRAAFITDATVREVPAGTRWVGDSGHPRGRRLPWPVDHG